YRLKTVMMSVSYSKDDDAIARFQPRLDPETNQTVIGSANLNFRETFARIVNFPLKVNAWWSMRLNIGGRWQKTNANFDETVLEFEQANWSMNGQQTFSLPSDFSAEFSGFYNSKQLIGTAIAQPIWGVNFGLQKVLSNNQGRLRFGIDDLFESIKWRGATEIPEQNLINRADYDFSNRTFKISYSRNFGNDKLKSYRKRQTGAEAERRRVN
ncbi:MAG: outer membrane beta-barrel protein, partial [Saprospiraceae bacterium]